MVTKAEKLRRIKAELDEVPCLPGVYLWKDASGEVIYVGKAKQLRTRMRQYVNFQDDRAKIPLLVDRIESFEYIVAESEYESLVLEKNLIDRYKPFFNADFKDDKSYPYIAITEGDLFPAIKYTREKHRPGTVYFGPYTDSRAARRMIEISRKIAPICSAGCAEWRRLKRDADKGSADLPGRDAARCFDCHVGIGPGACCGLVSPDDYRRNVERVKRFLKGRRTEFVEELRAEMDEAAAELDFERAARAKGRIDTIEGLGEKQRVVGKGALDADAIGFCREETIAGFHVLMVREGRVVNANEFILNKGLDVPDQDLLHNFLLRYYGSTTSIPHRVITQIAPEDADAMQDWLTRLLDSKHGARVRFCVPSRGEKKELLDMARTNAEHSLARYKVRTDYEEKRINDALLQLESALALERPPMRVECFDISTNHGSYTVASMVVFSGGRPDKNRYRRFKIKAPLEEADDFRSMQEVLARRYCAERLADERFGAKPDLVILDGGKPQLSAAVDVFGKMGVEGIALCGLAKRDEELFVTWKDDGPVVLPSGSPSLYLVKRIRDEAHRFAISFHRELRGKGMTASVLDDVAGIGPVRKKALLKHFKSFKRLCEASLEQIRDTHILPDETSRELYRVLGQYNARRNGCAETSGDRASGDPGAKGGPSDGMRGNGLR